MRRNGKLLAIIFTVTMALSGLTAVGQSQNIAPFEKQFVSLWDETLTRLKPPVPRWGGMTATEVHAMQMAGASFFLLDVRTPAEFLAERIAGAVNIPIDQLPLRLNELPADRTIPLVVYCKVGQRGGMGFALLYQLGYRNARHLIGGIDAWKAAGLPTDTSPVTITPTEPKLGVLAPYEKQFVMLWDETLAQLKVTPRWGGITPAETHSMLISGIQPFVLDVRTPAEFAAGRLPGAVNIPIDELPARLGELPKDRETIMVVYCKVGQRGVLGFSLVRQLGYVNVRHMIGGMDAWTAAGLPVER